MFVVPVVTVGDKFITKHEERVIRGIVLLIHSVV